MEVTRNSTTKPTRNQAKNDDNTIYLWTKVEQFKPISKYYGQLLWHGCPISQWHRSLLRMLRYASLTYNICDIVLIIMRLRHLVILLLFLKSIWMPIRSNLTIFGIQIYCLDDFLPIRKTDMIVIQIWTHSCTYNTQSNRIIF